ncbi:MAG TPA: hypothetical protein VEK05_00080 [Burkholderiales bacterium]|nr:hypothetical protein [Burkholderiales bacterium]
MEHDKALGILKILADGIDPGTGETLSHASPYQHPDTVRALYYAIRALENPNQTRERSAAQKNQPENSGRPWSDEEEAQLGTAFDSGMTILDLAREHKRSRIAIEARLVKLGKIPAVQSGTMRYPVRDSGGTTSGASDSARMM